MGMQTARGAGMVTPISLQAVPSMKLLIYWIVFTCLFACGGICRAQEKIAIPELLDFKTRTRTLQEYVLRADAGAEGRGWKDLATFSKAHPDIGVLLSVDRREGKRYAVTWKTVSPVTEAPRFPGGSDSKADLNRLFQPVRPVELISGEDLTYCVFDEYGSPVELDGAPSATLKGVVMDLNADGAAEVLEAKEYESVRYLMVRQLTGQRPLFAVAYEWGDLKKRGVPWDYAIRSAGADGTYEILFGPKLTDTIIPEVVFHWDAHDGTWACENPGEHLRVLGLKNVWKDLIQLSEGGPMETAPPGKQK